MSRQNWNCDKFSYGFRLLVEIYLLSFCAVTCPCKQINYIFHSQRNLYFFLSSFWHHDFVSWEAKIPKWSRVVLPYSNSSYALPTRCATQLANTDLISSFYAILLPMFYPLFPLHSLIALFVYQSHFYSWLINHNLFLVGLGDSCRCKSTQSWW